MHHLRRPQASFRSPKGEEALRPPKSDLRSPGKISRLGEYPRSRWEFSQKGEKKNDMGESVFPETDLFSLFSSLLIYLLLHIETNGNFKVTRGSAVLTFIIRCFIKMYTKRS